MTSGKHVRNLIWEGEPKTLDVKNLAMGPSHPLAELCVAREVTFRNMVRIKTNATALWYLDGEILLKISCWGRSQHSFTKASYRIL